MHTIFGSIWDPFCQRNDAGRPCPPAESYFPYWNGSTAEAGSDGVANAVAAPYNNGAITYVEYSYAYARNFPVVALLNQSGKFVLPQAVNVSAALTKAVVNGDHTVNLNGVYTNPDPQAYPVSYYDYLIAPTSTAAPFNKQKGATLGKFIIHALCHGQRKAASLGYAPLSPKIIQFGFDAESQIPGAPAPPSVTKCTAPPASR
jgi:ABC-type phosphate transport system substrate-binding protein